MKFYIVYWTESPQPVGWFSTVENAEEAIRLCYDRQVHKTGQKLGHFYWVERELDTIYGRFAWHHLGMFKNSDIDNVSYKELAND